MLTCTILSLSSYEVTFFNLSAKISVRIYHFRCKHIFLKISEAAALSRGLVVNPPLVIQLSLPPPFHIILRSHQSAPLSIKTLILLFLPHTNTLNLKMACLYQFLFSESPFNNNLSGKCMV
jgi:hypothetical protein